MNVSPLKLSIRATPAHRIVMCQINPSETSLLVTEPYFNLPNIAETYDQMVFEEWEFDSYFRCTRESTPLPTGSSALLRISPSTDLESKLTPRSRIAAALIPYGGLFSSDTEIPPECAIVVDIGYSFSHVIPLRDGQIIWEYVKR
jgi:actin-related protein 6